MVRRLLSPLRAVLPVEAGERPLALLLYAILTLMVLSDWVGKVGADSLFVKRYGVQYIPMMYLITPVAVLVISALLFTVLRRHTGRSLLTNYVAIVIVASLAIHFALPQGGIVLPIAYVFAHGVKEIVYLLFWIYAGNLYSSNQSKRLFPLFAGAMLSGKILGGFAVGALAPIIHTENFIGAQAFGFAGCLVLMLVFRRHLPAERDDSAGVPAPRGVVASLQDSLEGYRTITSDRLLRALAVTVFFWYLLMQLGTYLYLVGLDVRSTVSSARGSEDAFSQLYASVYTSSSLVALAIQLLLTGPLLRRLGVSRMLFLLPMWYFGAFAAAAASFNFVTAVAIQLGERVVIPAVHRPATELVYDQVPSGVRQRARAFLSGGVNSLGNFAAAAVLLGASASGIPVSMVLVFAAGASVAFFVSAWFVRRSFGRRLAQNLEGDDGELADNASQMLTGERHATFRKREVTAPLVDDATPPDTLAVLIQDMLRTVGESPDNARAERERGVAA